MNWNKADRVDHEALRRLAVVLLTLAEIAESVGRRSAPVRTIVLWLLCRAESRVRDLAVRIGAYVFLTSTSVVSPACPLGASGEAARLVRAFQALAAVFFALSRQARQSLRMAPTHDLARLPANGRNLEVHVRQPGAPCLVYRHFLTSYLPAGNSSTIVQWLCVLADGRAIFVFRRNAEALCSSTCSRKSRCRPAHWSHRRRRQARSRSTCPSTVSQRPTRSPAFQAAQNGAQGSRRQAECT